MKKATLLTAIVLAAIMTTGCGVKYWGKEMPFEDVHVFIDDSDGNVYHPKARVIFEGVKWDNEKFDVWSDAEDINVWFDLYNEHGVNGRGTIIKITPVVAEIIFGQYIFLHARSVTVITGFSDDYSEWDDYIRSVKKEAKWIGEVNKFESSVKRVVPSYNSY